MKARSRPTCRPLRTGRVLLRAALIGLLATAVAPAASARAQTLSFGPQPIVGPGDVALFSGSVASANSSSCSKLVSASAPLPVGTFG